MLDNASNQIKQSETTQDASVLATTKSVETDQTRQNLRKWLELLANEVANEIIGMQERLHEPESDCKGKGDTALD